MKTLFAIALCFICCQTNAQILEVKTFPGNEAVRYYTNSRVMMKGLSFMYNSAKEPIPTVFYIEDYKYTDIEIIPDKIKVSNPKICTDNYLSEPGHLIFSINSENQLTFYYHMRPEDTPQKI